MKIVLISIIAYLVGAIPFGLIFGKLKGIDPRSLGSKNIGATNVLRTAGPIPAIFTLIFDVSKGGFAVLLARLLNAEPSWIPGLFAIIGHNFPVYLGFRGGKGVATSIGTILVLYPPAGIIVTGIWITVALITRYSSLSAIISLCLSPLVFTLLKKIDMIGFTIAVAMLAIIRHRENIKRLMSGTEKRIGEKVIIFIITIVCVLYHSPLISLATEPPLIIPPSTESETPQDSEVSRLDINSLKEEALNRGLRFPEAGFSYIVRQKNLSPDRVAELIRLDPESPSNYFRISELMFKDDIKEGLANGMPYLISGFKASFHDLYWFINLTLLFSGLIILSIILAFIVASIIRLPFEIPLIVHEIRESRIYYLLPGILIISSIAGIPYFATAILTIRAIHSPSRMLKVFLGLWCIFLLALPFLYQIEQRFINILSDLEVRAVRDVNESRDNRLILVLQSPEISHQPGATKQGGDLQPSDYITFSKALALKREGRLDEAMEILKGLSEKYNDYRIFNNLGNCMFLKGDIDGAIRFYQKAIETKNNPQSLYNLSQASKERLDFEKGKQYYEEAMRLNAELVSRFTKNSSRSANRFLMDITLGTGELFKFSFLKVAKDLRSIRYYEILIPLLFLLLLWIRFPVVAYRCSRCGRIMCNICQRKELWGKMCPDCYDAIVTPDKTDSKTRLQRLLYLQKKKTSRKRLLWLLSLIPGAPHTVSERIISGISISSLVLLAILMFIAGRGYTIENINQSYLGVFGIATGVLGLIVHLFTLRRLSRVWP